MRGRFGGALLVALLLAAGAVLEAAFYDFEQITVDNTAAGVKLTAAKVPASLVYVSCRIRTAEISFLTVDPTKTTVTASVGQLLEVGDTLTITSREEALNLRMIRTGASSGQADCSYKYTQAP
jgi:carbamoylphosphate synthase large subunit